MIFPFFPSIIGKVSMNITRLARRRAALLAAFTLAASLTAAPAFARQAAPPQDTKPGLEGVQADPGVRAETAPARAPRPSASADGLVAAYSMNADAGTTVVDSSGLGNTGTATSTTWTAGKYGNALSFDGGSGLVWVEDAPSLRTASTLTLSAWVKPA